MKCPHGWIRATVLMIAFGLASCGTQKQPEDAPVEPAAQVVGRISTVDAEAEYVLIERLGAWDVPDRAMLHVRGSSDRAATLRSSGERQGRYVAADIVGGEVEIGDAVIYLQPVEPSAAGSPAEVETAPEGEEFKGA